MLDDYHANQKPQLLTQICVVNINEREFDVSGGLTEMSLTRALLCIIFPPLGVLDRGCGVVLIVFALTLAGWIPGVIAALVLNFMAHQQRI